MNSTDGPSRQSEPRWAQDVAASAPAPPNARESQVLREVLASMRRVQHGSIQIVIQDARVVQIDTTEKKRL